MNKPVEFTGFYMIKVTELLLVEGPSLMSFQTRIRIFSIIHVCGT